MPKLAGQIVERKLEEKKMCERIWKITDESGKGTNQREFIEIKTEGKECKIETGIE